MTPFATFPDITDRLFTHAGDERVRTAERHAAVRRTARRRRRRRDPRTVY
jgi:hypothetical protein